MTVSQPTSANAVLVAIDIAKHRHEVLLELPGRRRRRRWIMNLIARKKPKAAAVALANKMARIAWVLMARGESYAPLAA